MLAFCNRRQKKSPRDCADQLTKIIIKNMFFLNDGERKSQFPENKANTIGIRIPKKKLNSYTSCTAVNNFHSLIKKITQGLQMHACRMQMYVTYIYVLCMTIYNMHTTLYSICLYAPPLYNGGVFALTVLYSC